MPEPTDTDRRLLEAVLLLTERDAGKPPTLAEVAIALGYPVSGRSTVQRQLARLRPAYVTWNAAARSLQVTPEGLALLGRASPEAADHPAVDDGVLRLLARGLTELAAITGAGRTVQAPYPPAWQRGLNMLAAACVAGRGTPPQSSVETLGWCRQPLATWPVRFAGLERFGDAALLVDEAPSELARELAQSIQGGDAEMELSERMMLRIRNDAEAQQDQQAYVAVRRFLIEHAVIPQLELLQASLSPEMGNLGQQLGEMYERVPASALPEGRLWTCGFCGWTLARRNGRLHCADDRCRVLTRDFTVSPLPRPAPPDLYRVRRAIRRYVTAPGRYEIEAADRLRSFGLDVELWPCFDLYDLRIRFAHGPVWAIDAKDWRFPYLLAPHLTEIESRPGCSYSRAFYAVPDSRVDEDPDYLIILRRLARVPNTEIVTLAELVQRAQTEASRA
ncbi:MAG TPA: hypothetical protein VKY74_03355 [Chloroflexia bacterium]|nr:hypothetical protein [Chloroflexia bacterium]